MITEKEKMLSGQPYDPFDKELFERKKFVREVLLKLNAVNSFDYSSRFELLKSLLGYEAQGLHIESPFYCDYGENIKFGKNVYLNFNCIILDCAEVKIGDNTLIGPNVQILTPQHPLDVAERNSGIEYAKSITIGKNCWIGGGAIILAGLTIGEGCTIGAGAVVTKSLPANSVAVGNPAKV